MTEIKDYMLRLYDNKRIERNTKKEEVCIEEPALVILGMTVYETFASCVGAESLVDGFAQRFSYLIARKDPRRPMERFPLYELGDAQRAIAAKWKEIEQVPLHQTYSVNQECIDVFAAGFKALRPDDERLPDSFFRRIMFAGIRYALVYHVLRRDGLADLTPEDFSWAGRMVAMHITDARELLGTHGLGDLERLMQLAEVVKERCAAQGRACKARDLIRSISAIKTAPQAAGILALLADEGE